MIVILIYGFFTLLSVTILTAIPALVLASAFGYSVTDKDIDPFEYQRRFDLTALPKISKEEFERLASHDFPLPVLVRNYGAENLCITRDFNPSITLCVIKIDGVHRLYTFPSAVQFPCKNPIQWLFNECFQPNHKHYFDFRNQRPEPLKEGWYYSPEYGLERVIFDPNTQPPAPE